MDPHKIKEVDRSKNKNFLEELRNLNDIEAVLKKLQVKNEIFDLSWMKDEERNQFYDLSQQFAKDAKNFDSDLHDDDIFQALRNIWIIWMLELLFHKPLRYHKALFAYSMLYPYSDNLLDDASITLIQKQQFNQWFSDRLHGIYTPNHSHKKIDQLIAMIEHQFPRSHYADVYESLYAIQQAQIDSLKQTKQRTLQELFILSIAKGGTSVIADGYLIDGTLSKEEFQFSVDFGFALQIVDDLQDEQEDALHHHHTLATRCLTPEQRLALLQKCWIFFEDILADFESQRPEVNHFVVKSCHQLLASCILDHEALYPHAVCVALKEAMPVEQAYGKQLEQEMKEKIAVKG